MAALVNPCADRPLIVPWKTPRSLLERWPMRLSILALAALGLGSASKPPLPAAGLSPLARPVSFTTPNAEASRLVLAGDAALAANRQRPLDGRIESVAEFRFRGGAADFASATDCLAAAAYYEAGDDPGGQAAVAQVVINRLRHPAFPKSVCGVVFEGSTRRTGCQFTFTCDGSLARRPGTAAWTRARRTAAAALGGHVDPRVGTATHYHADYVLPYWAPGLRKLAKIGAHIFYRWPGSAGGKRVLRDPEPAREVMAARLLPEPTAPEGPVEDIALPGIVPGEVAGLAAVVPTPAPAAAVSDSTIMTLAEPGVASGRWAIDAMNACGGRRDCLVLVYGDAETMQRAKESAAASQETPLFLFARDGSGMDVALWDCLRVQRPGPEQCLPEARAALARLMRDRG